MFSPILPVQEWSYSEKRLYGECPFHLVTRYVLPVVGRFPFVCHTCSCSCRFHKIHTHKNLQRQPNAMCHPTTATTTTPTTTTPTTATATTTKTATATTTGIINSDLTTESFTRLSNMVSQTTTKQTSSRSMQKSVRFNRQLHVVASSHCKEEMQELCYSPQDLATFKFQFKQLCFANSTTDKNKQQQQIIDKEEGNLRGVESCSAERQLRRYQTIRCTVTASKKGYTDEQIAVVSRSCSKWNQRIAFVQACRDYAEIYEPSLMSTIPTIPKYPPRFPYEMKRKRKSMMMSTSSSSSSSSKTIILPSSCPVVDVPVAATSTSIDHDRFTRRVRRRTI